MIEESEINGMNQIIKEIFVCLVVAGAGATFWFKGYEPVVVFGILFLMTMWKFEWNDKHYKRGADGKLIEE